MPIPHPGQNDYWVSGVIFLCFILFVFVRIYYRKPFEQLFKSLFAGRSGNPALREEFSSSGRSNLFLSLLFLLTLSLFIYQCFACFRGTPDPLKGLLFFLKTLVFIGAAYLVKSSFIRWVGFVFKTSQTAEEYLYTVFFYTRLLGVILLPIIIASAYITVIPDVWLAYTGIVLICLTFLIRTAQATLAGGHNKSISAFYLFLYLCTLEILPLVVLIKVFMNAKGLFG